VFYKRIMREYLDLKKKEMRRGWKKLDEKGAS
jgi:hypothetical protein